MAPRTPRSPSTLIALGDALEALGPDGAMGERQDEIPVANIVGSAGRHADFDEDFQLVNQASQDRWRRIRDDVGAGRFPAPVDVVQIGELYFVRDGHHRVSVARHLGWDSIPAHVTEVCTVAYAMCCLRAAHLASKAAERRFLERIPLPDDVRRELWLDRPADWARLADAAESWAHRRHSERPGELRDHRLAAVWWEQEVLPVIELLRSEGAGTGLRDVQLYVTALAVRDRLGRLEWPPDLRDRLAEEECCPRVSPPVG